MERRVDILMVPLGIAWSVAGPLTYVLAVVHTWTQASSIAWKLLMNLTMDAILASVWPVTWAFWTIKHLTGGDTPLRLLFG